MKNALLVLATIFASTTYAAQTKYIITFKSHQGLKAMESYMMTESAAQTVQMKKSLKNVDSMVVTLKDKSVAERLKLHPEIQNVEAEFFFPTPKLAEGFKVTKSKAAQLMKFKAHPLESAVSVPEFKEGTKTPWGIVAVKAGDAWAGSAAGANARVAVLDTGVDATHPLLAQNFEAGRNFVSDDNGEVDPKNYADDEGHGTHVSGTILGVYNAETGFTGVAPLAKLSMGRVCGAVGCSSIAIVEGIDWAVDQKVDVINMSLGGPIPSSAQKAAVERAEAAGVVVVAASGNSANEPTYSHDVKDPKCKGGNFFQPITCGVSYPAANPTVVAVGALDASLAKTNFSQWGPELDVTAPGAAVISSVPQGSGRDSDVTIVVNGVSKQVKSAAFSGTALFPTPVINELVAVPGFGKPEDFAKVSVAGKFALVSRGEIKFSEKVQNAIAAKAAGVLIYNNTAGLMQGSLSEDGSVINFPVVMVEQAIGKELTDALTSRLPVQAEIVTKSSDVASFDGTSMASPHVAGVVALIRSANKNLTPAQVRQILSSTASALAPNDTNQYGAGIVQADKAVAAAIAQ